MAHCTVIGNQEVPAFQDFAIELGVLLPLLEQEHIPGHRIKMCQKLLLVRFGHDLNIPVINLNSEVMQIACR